MGIFEAAGASDAMRERMAKLKQLNEQPRPGMSADPVGERIMRHRELALALLDQAETQSPTEAKISVAAAMVHATLAQALGAMR